MTMISDAMSPKNSFYVSVAASIGIGTTFGSMDPTDCVSLLTIEMYPNWLMDPWTHFEILQWH